MGLPDGAEEGTGGGCMPDGWGIFEGWTDTGTGDGTGAAGDGTETGAGGGGIDEEETGRGEAKKEGRAEGGATLVRTELLPPDESERSKP